MHNEAFLKEYSSDDAVRRYTKKTAGDGIGYLLEHVYGEIYLKALREYLAAPIGDGVRVLEYGCGGGMNLLHCLGLLDRENVPVTGAYGTDFSERLIREARKEAARAGLQDRAQFTVARSECLISDMAAGLGVPAQELAGSFHLIIGVNTVRYCH